MIFLIYDENVDNDNNPIFERKDIFAQSCEITTTINITNFQQAEKYYEGFAKLKTYYLV